jgi:hypothetical protein
MVATSRLDKSEKTVQAFAAALAQIHLMQTELAHTRDVLRVLDRRRRQPQTIATSLLQAPQ